MVEELPPPPSLLDDCFSDSFIPSGSKLSMLEFTSESALNNFRMSVFANALVKRRNVTSTSRSPSTMVDPIARPSRTDMANSSPALNPSLSNLPYIPLTALPTYLDPTLTNLDCTSNGFDFWGMVLSGVDVTELLLLVGAAVEVGDVAVVVVGSFPSVEEDASFVAGAELVDPP
eukprot:CAMPEP_0196150296 /NCGR_PEP_ID=MMETSP0910-20130528/31504_1 /TAXON_ID=49265 /ORGANISM="Thalassiosira rotula, Strain GSO102" /LENGTH=173 /DNA_ID=CAMNT_0041413395 /DNA_START=72 /DNA_END=589 /DNA_ORIENTATION=-